MPAKTAYLALGANLGDRAATLQAAVTRLNEAQVRVKALSSLYETEPQGFAEQPWFLNAVARCETALDPLPLLQALRQIEQAFGRVRNQHSIPKGPRTLDLDILLYGNETLDSPQLTIPHPRMLERRFVLEPLLELEPDLRLPSGEPIAPYLASLHDQQVRKLP